MGLGSRDLVRAWAFPILLAGIALAFDAVDRRVPFSVLASGPLDEVAHLTTGALGLLTLACFIDAPRGFYVAGLIASVAIDLDHIPLYLGLGNPAQRPATHSLTTVLVIVVAAALSRRHRAVLAGAATGLLIHFVRDIAEGPPGVRMLWPLSNTAWTASFWWFLGMIITFTVVRLVLATVGTPRTRTRLFHRGASSPSDDEPEPPGLGRLEPVVIPACADGEDETENEPAVDSGHPLHHGTDGASDRDDPPRHPDDDPERAHRMAGPPDYILLGRRGWHAHWGLEPDSGDIAVMARWPSRGRRTPPMPAG
jgi:inner membrane protein